MPDDIPPPTAGISPTPDKDTAKGIADMSADDTVGGRVLHIKLFGFKYGSDDKTHSAAFVLSLILLSIIFIIIILGSWATNKELIDKALSSLIAAFTFTGGVAIGRGGDPPKSGG